MVLHNTQAQFEQMYADAHASDEYMDEIDEAMASGFLSVEDTAEFFANHCIYEGC